MRGAHELSDALDQRARSYEKIYGGSEQCARYVEISSSGLLKYSEIRAQCNLLHSVMVEITLVEARVRDRSGVDAPALFTPVSTVLEYLLTPVRKAFPRRRARTTVAKPVRRHFA